MKSTGIYRLIGSAIVVVAVLTTIIVSTTYDIEAADINSETILPLSQLQMLREDAFSIYKETHAVVGGIIWNDPLLLNGKKPGGYCMWDTDGKYDLFEGWFGIDDESGTEPVTLIFVGDGERLGSITLHKGDKARFFACPLKRCRAFTIYAGDYLKDVIMGNARLVRGRTAPSEPIDIYIDDGEMKYIERPGEYRFHVR